MTTISTSPPLYTCLFPSRDALCFPCPGTWTGLVSCLFFFFFFKLFILNNFTFTNIIKNSHILVSLNVDILHDQCTITYAIKLTLIQSYQLIYKKFYQLSHVGRQNSVVPKISSPSCSTHFLLVIQSNTNLSAAMGGFCSCN